MSDITAIRQKLSDSITAGAGVTAGGYTLNTANVALGYVGISASTEFLKTTLASSPYLLFRAGALTDNDDQGHCSYRVPATLWLALTPHSNNNIKNPELLLEAIKNAVWTNYNVGPLPRITWSEPELDSSLAPMVLKYDLEFECQGC